MPSKRNRDAYLLRAPALFATFALICTCFGARVQAEQIEPTRDGKPNIIIIMADDMGYSDLGCYGSEIETPHLDALADGGVRFTQFYNTARCCPTRAALLTGLHQHQAGIGHMTGNKGTPSYQGFLNDRCVTIAEALKPAGYTTLMVGKWHVGSAQDKWPTRRGFGRYFGTPTGGGVYFKEALAIRKTVFFTENETRVELPDDFYVTDSFTDYALKFVTAAAEDEQPFFLYVAHIAPHWPLQAKPKDIAKYHGRYDAGWDQIRAKRYQRQVEMGIIDEGWKLSPRDAQAKPWKTMPAEKRKDLSHRMAVYAAQIDCIDQNVGRLVATLKELKVFDNTVIMFLSDNGCSAEGGPGGFSRGKKGVPIGEGASYASAGLEWANVSDTPFRKYKISTHEGGIASPLIVHWPAGLKRKGEVEEQPGHVIDLMPTCLELAAAQYLDQRNGKPTIDLAGISLVPAWNGQKIERRPLYWEHQGNRAVRDGDWKLVASVGGRWELYDLSADRTELNNLADAKPDQVKRMAQQWDDWARRCGVEPWPVRK